MCMKSHFYLDIGCLHEEAAGCGNNISEMDRITCSSQWPGECFLLKGRSPYHLYHHP